MVKVIGDLVKEVIEPGFCLGCNACTAACPVDCIKKEKNEVPVLKKGCINCGICYGQCPQVVNPKTLQKAVFGDKAADEFLGTYTQALSVEARDAAMKAHAQDGGAVTALLSSLLDEGYIDGAVVVGTGEAPWQPVARVATTTEELIEYAGSKYSGPPLFLGLRDAVDLYYCKRLAIVGTPCNIAASWRMHLSEPRNRRLSETIRLRVGLFCGGVFGYEEFFKSIVEKQLRIPLSDVAKFDIRRNSFLIYIKRKGKRELTLDPVKKYLDLPCKICSDFAAELADISVGAAGSPPGRSTVILRTQTGVEAFDSARKFRKFGAVDIEQVKPGIEEAREKAKEKKSAALKALEIMRRQKKTLPIWLQERPPEAVERVEPLEGIRAV